MYWGWQRLPKGTKPKKVGVYIPVLLLPRPCQTRSPFFPLHPVGVGCSSCISPPTLPDHRAPGEQGHWGANIWVRLKHPLLKDLPCLLWQWPRPRDSVSSVVLFLLFYFCYFFPWSSKHSSSRQSRRLTVFFCSDQRCLLHPCPGPRTLQSISP